MRALRIVLEGPMQYYALANASMIRKYTSLTPTKRAFIGLIRKANGIVEPYDDKYEGRLDEALNGFKLYYSPEESHEGIVQTEYQNMRGERHWVFNSEKGKLQKGFITGDQKFVTNNVQKWNEYIANGSYVLYYFGDDIEKVCEALKAPKERLYPGREKFYFTRPIVDGIIEIEEVNKEWEEITK